MSNAVSTTGTLVKRQSAVGTIVSNSIANPTVLTFATAQGFATGDSVLIAGNITSSPAINGAQTITRITSTTFSVPVNVTTGGTGGTVTATGTITSNSIANPTVITFSKPQPFATGDTVTIVGNITSSPSINGSYVVTKLTTTTFSIPVNVTTGGTGGTVANFVTVAEITKAGPPGFTRNKLETSTHNDGTESYQLGILRQKDGTLTINYIGGDITHATLLSDMLNNISANWKFLLPSGIQYDGPARVQQFQLQDAGVDGIQAADMVLTWNGPVIQS